MLDTSGQQHLNEVKSMNQSNYLLCFVRIQVCFYLELYEFRFISTLFCTISGLFQPVFLRFDIESNLNCRNSSVFVPYLTIIFDKTMSEWP